MGRDTLNNEGYIYGLVHPSRPGYLKIGRTINPEARLRHYNTGDPRREYYYAFLLKVTNAALVERWAHMQLCGLRTEAGEWFQISPADALTLLFKWKEDNDSAGFPEMGGIVATEVRHSVADGSGRDAAG